MPQQTPEPDTLIDAMAALLDIEIEPEYRPGIVTNLGIAIRFAALLRDAPLDDRDEPAPVFRP
ncbi:DUF4089 domain-containing protein [Lichenihabitans sp. PAMC28606]|uniref:DUF4089 domain-containing protein n=1 Tax=Lichenihabitans sp. PAMC28606 TaxID=2880932 RepID=UPI001D0B05D7|nr:DUF4089 domain-containing protein [Lichenihabitans sp. PAMC28606]UDL95981.1 DUF4089 domain-containing protein [Lichenihabitans sp. PAMC28606]